MTFKHLKDNNLGDSINLAPELRGCSIERSGAQQETLWLVPRPGAVVPHSGFAASAPGKNLPVPTHFILTAKATGSLNSIYQSPPLPLADSAHLTATIDATA